MKIIPLTTTAEIDERIRNSGLLYAINRFILHPEGLVLLISYEDDDKEERNPRVILARTEDGKPWSFDYEYEKELKLKLSAFLKDKVSGPLHLLANHYLGEQ